ncbi:Scr1 family TA system antitoxin-like transcriptional regulator [Streptomyces xiamenensis]|uniref:Scr1 family TA system antitoxin-like transcriptional regulator n=1 Tax=Streptomyces xiamenensis TaxID=408015 RepID=UPI0035E0AC0F
MTVHQLHTERPAPVARRRIGAHLAVLRADANLTLTEAARAAQITPGRLARAERGESLLTPRAHANLLDRYGATEQQRDNLTGLLRLSTSPAKCWTDEGQARRRRLMAIQAPAIELRIWAVAYLPAILRTQDAVQDLARWPNGWDKRDLAAGRRSSADFASGHMGRAALLLDESWLKRVLGSREAMADQLEHLLHLQHADRIRLRVVGFDAGRLPPTPTVQVDFGPDRGHLAYDELHEYISYTADSSLLEDFTRRFAAASDAAMSIRDSRARITEAIAAHRAGRRLR